MEPYIRSLILELL